MSFKEERLRAVRILKQRGVIRTKKMEVAMLKVKRELFMPEKYKQNAYFPINQAFPIPPFDSKHTISALETYPMFYEPLDLKKGDKFLEIGTGSGYGAALARELVGKKGNVVTIERNRITYEFAKQNLKKAGYKDILVICGDGTKGYPPESPYNKICITASFIQIPKPLKEQLAKPGKLIMPVGSGWSQRLTLLEKDKRGEMRRRYLGDVIYVRLIGEYGWKE